MLFEGTLLDAGVHILTFLVALVIFVVSVASYRKRRTRKFLVVCAAFGVFALKEALLTVNILVFSLETVTGAVHLLNLVILSLFFYGVVR